MKDTLGDWKTLSSKIAYTTPFFLIKDEAVTRPDGSPGRYWVIEYHHPGISIVALTAKNEIYLLRLRRYPTGAFAWEVPAGGTDGQDPLEAAQRELLEEIGMQTTDWQAVGELQAMNGGCSQMKHVFVARNVKRVVVHEQQEQQYEGIAEIKKVPFAECLSMVKNHEITDAHSVSAIMLAGLHLGLL